LKCEMAIRGCYRKAEPYKLNITATEL
jgi:hypothetical protein